MRQRRTRERTEQKKSEDPSPAKERRWREGKERDNTKREMEERAAFQQAREGR